MILCAASDEAMYHKAVVTLREHDLTGLDVFERAAFDLNYVAGPKGGQHAFTVNFRANELTHPRTSTATQNISHQRRAYRAPIRERRIGGVFRHQEVFREN
jgi:hypothetical protein